MQSSVDTTVRPGTEHVINKEQMKRQCRCHPPSSPEAKAPLPSARAERLPLEVPLLFTRARTDLPEPSSSFFPKFLPNLFSIAVPHPSLGEDPEQEADWPQPGEGTQNST